VEPDDDMLSRVLERVPQPVWVVGPDGLVVFANPAALAVLGYDHANEVTGRPSHETLHPLRPDGAPNPASECRMLSPLRTGRTIHGDDEWLMRRDGSFVPVYWWSSPVALPTGRGVIYSFFDLSERRVTEEAARARELDRVRAAELRASQRRIVESIDAVHRQTARDLHDGAQQRLVSLMIGLRMAREMLSEGHGAALELIDRSIEDARTAIDELRDLAAGIYPPALTVRGLPAAVRSLAARLPVPAEIVCDLDRRLPPALESNAYFFVAECLTNAVKHARATRISVTLALGSEHLELAVSDDGVGGVPTSPRGASLVGLHDRVSALDGTLTISSPPGRGTRVVARVPVRASER
jgi:PAS domain S-box-containing protein